MTYRRLGEAGRRADAQAEALRQHRAAHGPQEDAWLDELWVAIDLGDVDRLEVAQGAFRREPGEARGWPAGDAATSPAELPTAEEHETVLPVPGEGAAGAETGPGADAPAAPGQGSGSRRGAYARRRG